MYATTAIITTTESESASTNGYCKCDTQFVRKQMGGLRPTRTDTKVPLEQEQIVSAMTIKTTTQVNAVSK